MPPFRLWLDRVSARLARQRPSRSKVRPEAARSRMALQRRKVAKQAAGGALERLLPVVVRGIELGEDGDRDAVPIALEERHLVVDAAGPGRPAALEVELPASRPDAADAPTLRGDYRGQESPRVRPVPPRDVTPEVIHEARLV